MQEASSLILSAASFSFAEELVFPWLSCGFPAIVCAEELLLSLGFSLAFRSASEKLEPCLSATSDVLFCEGKAVAEGCCSGGSRLVAAIAEFLSS